MQRKERIKGSNWKTVHMMTKARRKERETNRKHKDLHKMVVERQNRKIDMISDSTMRKFGKLLMSTVKRITDGKFRENSVNTKEMKLSLGHDRYFSK